MNPGIYIHLPFCSVHCTYCDFPLTTRVSLSDRYYSALLREIDQRRPETMADTLYFGGGTPSLTPARILKEIRERFALVRDSEITMEANPDDIDRQRIHEWKHAGINRLSVGVQSLEPAVLRCLLRKHDADTARHALADARNSGCSNLNIDLMIGCPEQTSLGFLGGLRELIDFHPDHFSLYLLEIHENTALAKQLQDGRLRIMEENEQVDCYSEAITVLKQAGFDHYEVSNFALPGKQSIHNLKYWSSAEYFGFGAGAASYVDGVRNTNQRSIETYIRCVEEMRSPVETESKEDAETKMRNALIFGLRKTRGINLKEFESEFAVPALMLFGESADTFLENRWLEIHEETLRLTLSGMLLSNEILSVIV